MSRIFRRMNAFVWPILIVGVMLSMVALAVSELIRGDKREEVCEKLGGIYIQTRSHLVCIKTEIIGEKEKQ